MTIAEAIQRFEAVRDLAQRGDHERTHDAEDEFYIAILQAIADGSGTPQELARIALQTQNLGHERWCA